EAMDYVFGYSNANDVSERESQFKTSQWLTGKTYDGFCPVGPYIVTLEELGERHKLRIKTYVNGELRQDSNTNDMIFKSKSLVSHISQYMTLEPGDIILTGTPEGVASGYKTAEKSWIKDVAIATVEIESLGRFTNRFEMEREECVFMVKCIRFLRVKLKLLGILEQVIRWIKNGKRVLSKKKEIRQYFYLQMVF